MAERVLQINTAQIEQALRAGMYDIPAVIEQAVGDVLDKWKAEATNLALKKDGDLRKGISVEQAGQTSGVIKSVAIQNIGKWGAFNYAYYWHEHRKDNPPKNVTTSGTVANYLDKAAEDNQADWEKYIAAQIDKRLKQMGR